MPDAEPPRGDGAPKTAAEICPSSPLPDDDATLVGRVWMPGEPDGEPLVVSVEQGRLYDITRRFDTVAQLLNSPDPANSARPQRGVDTCIGDLSDFLQTVTAGAPWPAKTRLLAPCDLQPIKASGVTFLESLKERVIEEAVRGERVRATQLRATLGAELDARLSNVVPGSKEAAVVKEWLLSRNLWSQYLEVALGPDAEIFSKASPLSAVGFGGNIGILTASRWNNSEPEIVLAINRAGDPVGATLGNDVNLRDIEGRSALLLGKAKDNNASCAVGPFIRLFDQAFDLKTIGRIEISFDVRGEDGFSLQAKGLMSGMSRDPSDLVRQTVGPHHQYPDGCMLFLGTMFAPTADRGERGRGFTHSIGDTVSIRCAELGMLVNRIDYCERIEPWTFGLQDLIECVKRRSARDESSRRSRSPI